MKYAVNENGINALRSMASFIIDSFQRIENIIKEAQNLVENNAEQLGPHVDTLNASLSDIGSSIKEVSEPVRSISDQLNELADSYETIIENDMFLVGAVGGAVAGSIGIASGLGNSDGDGHVQSINQIESWIKSINPNYSPYSPYGSNCGTCAFAVHNMITKGNAGVTVGSKNIAPYLTDMEKLTGKKATLMGPSDIEKILKKEGPGSEMIVGITRSGGNPGHWFNVFYDGNKVYTVDGQVGKIYDWPHDYGLISGWYGLV